MLKLTIAMIMAAGRGVRMRQLTDELPKPLLQVHGKSLLNHVVDRISAYGIPKVVVNTCYKADLIKQALLKNTRETFVFSDEETALETGGGVKKALPLLMPEGENGFFVLNSDPLWTEPNGTLLDRMAAAWNPEKMDILLALVPVAQARGDVEKGNYFIEEGQLRRIRPEETTAPYFFISAQIMHPRVFQGSPDTPFSSRDLFDKAQKAGRLGYVIHDGLWFNVNTPEALAEAEALYYP